MLCILIRIPSIHNNMLWVLIRIADEAILMSTHVFMENWQKLSFRTPIKLLQLSLNLNNLVFHSYASKKCTQKGKQGRPGSLRFIPQGYKTGLTELASPVDPVWSPPLIRPVYLKSLNHYGTYLKAISEVWRLWFLLHKGLAHWQKPASPEDPVWSPPLIRLVCLKTSYHYGIYLKATSEVRRLWFFLNKGLVHWQSLHLQWTLSVPLPAPRPPPPSYPDQNWLSENFESWRL